MRKHKSTLRRYIGRHAMTLISLALIVLSAWEASVRMDAMYKPLKMFFGMAVGEGIPLSAAMNYFDWSIFEAPLWLLCCALTGLIILFFCRRKGGALIIIPFGVVLAGYGLARESTLFTDLWKLVQPALLLAAAALSALNLMLNTRRSAAPRDLPDSDGPRMGDAPRDLPDSDGPRMGDAPRLRGVRSRNRRNQNNRFSA